MANLFQWLWISLSDAMDEDGLKAFAKDLTDSDKTIIVKIFNILKLFIPSKTKIRSISATSWGL